MGRELIPGTIWKISCNNLFITYFTLTFSKHRRGPGGSMSQDYLATRTSLSPIRRGLAPGFVNYNSNRSASEQVYQLLVHGRWFSPGTLASPTTKTGRHDIAEILLKVALKHQKSNQIKSNKSLFSSEISNSQVQLDKIYYQNITPLSVFFQYNSSHQRRCKVGTIRVYS